METGIQEKALKRLRHLTGSSSPIDWDNILDVYAEYPRDFFLKMMEAPSRDAQDDLCGAFFSGMFHQEIAEPDLPKMMEPVLLVCLLDTTVREVRAHILVTLGYIVEQGLTMAGRVGFLPVRLDFIPDNVFTYKTIYECQCREALRKSIKWLYTLLELNQEDQECSLAALHLWELLGEAGDMPMLGAALIRHGMSFLEDNDELLLTCGLCDLRYGSALTEAYLTAIPGDYGREAFAVAKSMAVLPLEKDEANLIWDLCATLPLTNESRRLSLLSLLAVFKASDYSLEQISGFVTAQKAAYGEILKKARELEDRYNKRLIRAYQEEDEFDHMLESWKCFEEKTAIGWTEWPVHLVICEYAVMVFFQEHLGRGKVLSPEELTPDQAKLIAFLRETGIRTSMEEYAGWVPEE